MMAQNDDIIEWIKTGQVGNLQKALEQNPVAAEGKTKEGVSLLCWQNTTGTSRLLTF